MASYTPNYNLKKPADSDYYDIADNNGNMDKIDTALNTLNANMTYKTGDVFNTRSWRTVGRIINSGQGLFCWIDMAKPVNSTSFNISFDGTPNIFGIGVYTASGTVSNKLISGNELQFVIDLSSTHTVGQIGIAEFNASITLT